MSVTEADVMTLMGETQEATVGGRQADIAAAIERQAAYEAGERAEFGTGANLGPQFLAQAVPFVTGAAFGSITSFGIGAPSPTRLGQVPGGDPQVNFPRGVPRGANPFPPEPRLPVPYEPPIGPSAGAVLPGIFPIIGGIIGALWEGWPNTLGTETGPFDTRAPAGAPQDPTNAAPNPDLGPIPPSDYGPPGPADAPQQGLPPYAVPGPYDFGDAHDRARRAMEDQIIRDSLPAPVPPPAPAPTPAARTLPPWVWPVVGGLGTIALARRSRSSFTLPVTSLSGVSDPLTTPLTNAPSASTASAVSPLVFVQSGIQSDDGCNCSSKKRGKKRRCLARAQLTWRSGPKKGKAAGSRCYRFAD